MKSLPSLIVLLLFALASCAYAQDSTPKKSRPEQLFEAYGFVLGQQISLELIEKKFPDLSEDTKQSWIAFESSALGKSATSLEEDLSSNIGDKWPQAKQQLTSKIQGSIEQEQLTRDKAISFLAEVQARAKGRLPDPILSTLLSVHPRYTKEPELELTEGWKQTYRTKGHPKAKGVDFSISFPASWSRREGYRPNIIQFFQSGAGHGPMTCSLMVKNMPLPAGYIPTQEEVKELFQSDEFKRELSETGTVVEIKPMVLEGAPAVMFVCDHTQQRLDITLSIRMIQFATVQGASMICIQFPLAKQPDSKDSLDDLQRKYLPIYRGIVNTFVLNDRYN